MAFPQGQALDLLAAGRLAGHWRYDRAAGRGIALSYDRRVIGAPAPRRPDVHTGDGFTGRWRYNCAAGRGIALSYDQSVNAAPAPPRAQPKPTPRPPWHSPTVRVLCSCGEVFTFDGEEGICPGCGRPAAWPTMNPIEREMRSDLADLLRAHEERDYPD